MKASKYEIDMTTGAIMPKMFSFFLPLMFSGILQLLFNAVDIIVVGRFTGSQALAAVGATSALINMLTNLFIGISLGANVLAARYYASGENDSLHEVVHTAVSIAIITGVIMVAIGLIASRPALRAMDTPSDVIDQAVLYMRIYFCGMPFFMIYNYCAAILRAVGDTKRPLLFLIIAGTCNACLNVFLVAVFHLGVAGVAIATVVSQFISCTLVLRVLIQTKAVYRLEIRKLHINTFHMKRIFKIGVPAGMQSMVISFSNVLLQSSVNSFGSHAMAGYTAANNLLSFMYVCVDSIAQGCMNFTSQNMGVRKKDRMDRTLLDCFFLEVAVGLILGVLVTIFNRQLLHIYTTDEEAVASGLEIASITVLPYFLCGIMNLMPGAMRGMGLSTIPMILTVIGTVGLRIVWIFWLFPSHHTLFFLFISYPLSWLITIILQVIFYIFVRKKVYASL